MNRTRFFFPFPMIALLALAACENSTGSDAGPPARLDVIAGDLQSATVGTALPAALVVKVVDDKGKAVKGQVVNFRVVAGGGSVFAGAAQTDKDGIAQERWTLGTSTADTQKVEVRAVDSGTGEQQVFGVFRAVALADVPAAVAVAGTAAKSGAPETALADSPAVKVTDRYGNPVPGAAVVWTAEGGSAIGAASQTNAAGIAKGAWTLPLRLGVAYAANATVGAAGSVRFTATATVPATAVLEKVSGDGQQRPPRTRFAPLEVRLRTADGRPIEGAEVTWTGFAMVPGSVTPTAADGRASAVPEGMIKAEVRQGAARSGTASVSFTLTVVPGDPDELSVDTTGVQVGATGTVRVRVIDSEFNSISGVTVNFKVVTGGSTVSPTSGVSDAAGYVQTGWSIPPAAGVRHLLEVSSPAIDFPPVVRVDWTSVAGPAVGARITVDTLYVDVGTEIATMKGFAYDGFGNEVLPRSTSTGVRGWTFESQDSAVAVPVTLPGNFNMVRVRGVSPGTTTFVGRFRDAFLNLTFTATAVVVVR
ncbi:MAG TPA: Ig-like domain-containing protein [Longimicrobium sp.]|nr:Ig-like domain-containing protein [Longimicrobium sp.]